MNEVVFVQSNLAPVAESSSLTATQPVAGVCLRCGKPILIKKRKDAKWCSLACRSSHAYYSRDKHRLRKLADIRLEKHCRSCGVGFKAKHPLEKECSYRCYLDFRIKSRGRPVPVKTENCINCNNPIPFWKMAGTKFCGQSCASRAQAKKQSRNPTIQQKIRRAFAHRMRAALRHAGGRKTKSTFDLLGCDSQSAKDWIESRFLPGMCWENWGKVWHVDHIIPCASFNLLDESEQKKCFHYANLQPLWLKDNIQKGNRLDWKPSRL